MQRGAGDTLLAYAVENEHLARCKGWSSRARMPDFQDGATSGGDSQRAITAKCQACARRRLRLRGINAAAEHDAGIGLLRSPFMVSRGPMMRW